MRKTTTMIIGAVLAAAPGVWGQAAATAPPAQADQIKRQLEELRTVTAQMATGPSTFTFMSGQMFNGAPVKGQPYSAEAVNETTQVLPDGNRIVNRSSTTMYRDSEGRERREESIGKIGAWTSAGEPAKAVFISDPVAKMSYTLHTADRTAEKIPAPANMAGTMLRTNSVTAAGGGTGDIAVAYKIEAETAALHAAELHAAAGAIAGGGGRGGAMATSPTINVQRRVAGPAPKVEELGTQMIEGIAANGTRTTQTIPAGQIGNEREINIVSERWFSPDLQVVVMTKRSDPRTGETVYKLTNVSRSEPQRYLFEIPGDYTVSEPSTRSLPRKVVVKEDQ